MQATKHFRKRDAILEYLRHTQAHPSAEKIFTDLKEQIPDLAIGTVYRNLALFKEKGLVSSVATVNGVERFDANTAPHVHFVCNGCTAVIDLHQMQIPASLYETAAGYLDGKVDDCHVAFTGTCRECLNLMKSGEAI